MTYTRTRTSFAWLAALTLALGPPAAAQDKSAAPALAADVTFYGSSSSPILLWRHHSTGSRQHLGQRHRAAGH